MAIHTVCNKANIQFHPTATIVTAPFAAGELRRWFKNMNKLLDLYQSNYDLLVKVRETLSDEHLEGPLLMKLSEYYSQKVKLFIIGQETNGWSCEYKDHNALMDT